MYSWLTKDLMDGGQLMAKPHLRKTKPNYVFFIPQLVTIYQVVG